MTATYINGQLSALEGIQHMGRMWEDVAINAPIPAREADIPAKQAHYAGLMLITPCQYNTPGEKISLFCRLYKHHRGSSYVTFPADSRVIERVTVNEELLNAYFTNTAWWASQPKSIRNYCSNYNEVRQLLKPKEETKPKARGKNFPDEYDRQYESTLKPQELALYWAHLRSLGLAPEKENGRVTGWKRAQLIGLLLLISLLLGSCMTPQRVARYIQQHPDAVELQYDSIYLHHIFHDTIYLPADSFSSSWEWSALDDDQPLDTTITQGRQSISFSRQRIDTVYRYRLTARIIPDTFYLADTLYLPCPSGTATVSAKWSFPWWGWLIIIVVSLLIISSWLRRK